MYWYLVLLLERQKVKWMDISLLPSLRPETDFLIILHPISFIRKRRLPIKVNLPGYHWLEKYISSHLRKKIKGKRKLSFSNCGERNRLIQAEDFYNSALLAVARWYKHPLLYITTHRKYSFKTQDWKEGVTWGLENSVVWTYQHHEQSSML